MNHKHSDTLLLHFSDTHICAPGRLLLDRVDTAALLKQAVASVLAAPYRPDALLISGDLVDRGSVEEYEHLRRLLAPLACPIYLMAGNHDERIALQAALPEFCPASALPPFVQYAADIGGLRLITLDTVVPGAPHGELCEQRLAWLERCLSEAPERPTIVAMHHPPFATGIAHMDAMGLLKGAPELEALLRRHPQVERLLCGHLHRPIQRRFGGTLAMTVPSTAHQIHLDLAPDAAALFCLEPPGYALHLLREGQVLTHLVASGQHGEPQAF